MALNIEAKVINQIQYKPEITIEMIKLMKMMNVKNHLNVLLSKISPQIKIEVQKKRKFTITTKEIKIQI